MATNIDIQQQLNDLLEQQSKIMEAQAKMMKSQISLAQDLVDSLSKINYKSVAEDVTATQEAVDKAQASTSKFGGASQTVYEQVTQSVEEAAKSMLGFNDQTLDAIEKVGKLGFIAGSAMSGFIAGLKFTGNSLKTVLSLGTGMLGFLGDLAASIIAIPFKMLSGLISMADTGGSNELATQLEEIRKEFGALHTTAGKAIIDISRSMKGELANSGLSVYRVMGNLAERLKDVAAWAKQLGPLFEVLAPQIVKNSEAFAAYTKGLGLTDAGLKAVGARAFATGQDITEIQRQIANYSLQLGKSFGLSSKMISRDMGEMMADFKHFGSLAPQQLAQVSVFARKLGVDIKALVGVIDKFDNFEDAAAGAAHLSQAFGLNVDALELMKAQNPAERVEMLRKAFFNAGRSVESMTRQERSLLAQQSGVGDDALDLVFSLKNQATSYADIQKKGGAAHKQQLTQAQAMKGLADSIERLVKSGSAGAGGFFDRFIQGFTVGIRRSTEFRQLMYAIQKSLMVVFNAGIRVGRMFVDMFPGVNNIIKNLRDFFDPSKIRNLMKNVVEAFRKFFKALTSDPQTALPELMKNLRENFLDFFKSNSSKGRAILDGFKNFFKALAQIGASMLKLALEGITTGVRYIIDLLQGNVALPGMGGAGGEATGFIGEILGPIIEALKSAWPPLWNALKNLFHEVLYNHVAPFLLKHAPLILGVLFGPSVIGMVGRTFTSTLITMMLGGLSKSLASLATRGSGMIGGAFQKLTGAASRTAQAGAGAGSIGGAGAGATAAINAAEAPGAAANRSRLSMSTVAKLAVLTAVIGVGMYFLITKGLVPLAKSIQDQHITGESIRSASLTMVAAAGAMTAMAGSLALLNIATRGLNGGTALRMIAGVAIIAAVAAGMAWEGKHIINYLKDIPVNDLKAAGLAMAAIGAFFVAAAAVTGIAALVGAVALAGGGLGAVAIAAGLLAISTTIGIMATQGMLIMHAIDRFNPAPGFEMKAKAFATIIQAISAFAGTIARLIEAARPSFVSFLFGNPEQEMRDNLASVNVVIAVMMTSIGQLVTTIQEAVSRLSGSESQLKAAEAFAGILSAVGTLAGALTPPVEQLQAPGVWDRLLGATGNTGQNIRDFGQAFQSMSGAVVEVIQEVQSALIVLTRLNFTEAQRANIQMLPSLLTSVAELAKALTPNPAVAARLSESRNIGAVAGAVSDVVTGLLDAIQHSHIISNVANLVMHFMNAIQDADFTPQTINVLRAALPAMTSIFSAIGGIATTLGTLVTATTGAHANPNAINQATIFITGFMNSLSTTLPNIMSSMLTAFRDLTPSAARSVAAGAAALNTITGAITQIINANIPTGGDMAAKFAAINVALFSIQTGINAVSARLESSVSLPASITDLVTRIRAAHIERVSGAVKAMVDSINATGAALRGLHAVDIETRLQSVAGNLGLGAAGQYRIDNRNFTIVVNFSVKIDQPGLEALELALTTRPRSNIAVTGPTRR